MNMSIKSNIENRRYRLQALHEELPLFEAEEARLKAELGRIQKDRLWLRRTCKPNMQLALCRAHITRLRQRLDEKKFDERLRPFLQAAERTLTEATASKPSVLRLPGATKRRKLSSLNNYIASKDNSLHGSVLHEYMVEFEQAAPDAVINLAARAGVRYSLENPQAYIDSNVVGFTNVLECCRHNSIGHLVYASSSSVYGMNESMPFSIHDNVDHPISLYAATKKANELMAHTYSHLFNLPTTGLRFFTVYGPWGRPDMALFLFTKAIVNKEPIKVFNNVA